MQQSIITIRLLQLLQGVTKNEKNKMDYFLCFFNNKYSLFLCGLFNVF